MTIAAGTTAAAAQLRRLGPAVVRGLPRAGRLAGRWAGWGVLLAVFPFFAGAVLALGGMQLDMLLFGAVLGTAFLFVPASGVLYLLVPLTFVMVGVASYFLSFDKGFWLPYLLCMLLLVKLPIEALQGAASRTHLGPAPPMVMGRALLPLVLAVVISALFNGTPVLPALVGAKNFVFVWSVLLLFSLGRLHEKVLERIWLSVLWISVLQLPFTIYQHFFVATRNANNLRGGISWDAVVGTFGGKIDGGGASGTLALFQMISILLTLLLLEAKVIGRRTAFVVVGAAALSILLAEVKVVFVLLPVMVLGLLRGRLLRNPVTSLLVMLFSLVLVAGLFFAYQQMYWNQSDSKTRDADRALEYVLKFDTSSTGVNQRTGEVSRFAAPLIWWRENSARGADLLVFGHGPSASRVSETIGYGVAAKRYPFALDTSSMTVLLWDLGLMGFLSFVALLVTGAVLAMRLTRHPDIPPLHQAVMRAVPTGIAIILITLPYNKDSVDNSALQILICLMLGHPAYWYRRVGGRLSVRAKMKEGAAPAGRDPADALRGRGISRPAAGASASASSYSRSTPAAGRA